jgi:hypothetical protein
MFVLAVNSLIAAGLLRRSRKHATITLVCSVCHRDSFAIVRLFVELLCRTCLICREQFDRGGPFAAIAETRDNNPCLFSLPSGQTIFAIVRLFVELLCRTCLICREQFDRGEPSATIAVMRDNYSSLFKTSSAIETALLFEPESTVFATIATYGTRCQSNLDLFFLATENSKTRKFETNGYRTRILIRAQEYEILHRTFAEV